MKKNQWLLILIVLIIGVGLGFFLAQDRETENTNSESVVAEQEEESTADSEEVTDEEVAEVEEPTEVKRLVIRSESESFSFPSGVGTSFDASGDVSGGAFISAAHNNASFVGRDLYILQKINETIGMEVDDEAATVVFPAGQRFETDHDGVENITGWECGGASMSDRDSYLLYAITEVRRGQSPTTIPFGFFGSLVAATDSGGGYTIGQCEDVEGVYLEGRDRYLLDMINSLSIVVEVVEE